MQRFKNEWIEVSLFYINIEIMNIEYIELTNILKAEKSVKQETIEESWNKCTLKEQVDIYFKILEEKTDKNAFFIDFNELFTAFMKQPSNEYQHRSNYELFWCQDLYKRM